MLLAGLLPLLLLGGLVHGAAQQLLSLSAAPLEEVLDAVALRLEAHGEPSAPLTEARLHLAQAELARRALVRRLPWAVGTLVLLAAAGLALSALLLGRALARPVTALAEGMWALRRGELTHELPAPPPGRARDELGFLLAEFNAMGRELHAQRERLREAERVAAWQDVARTLAHELKNPLTAMKLALARLTRPTAAGAPPDATRLAEAAAHLEDELQRLLDMTRSFSAFARLPATQLAPLALRPLLAEVCALWGEAGPVPVELCEGPEATARADADALRRLVGNLVKNALEASQPSDAPVRVALEAGPSALALTVEDGGAGIGRALSGEALTRGLFSTKPGGSGLGLPIAQKIAHEHGGSLRLEPRGEGRRGTRAVLVLPAPPHAAEEHP
jgi:nitrogen fixation/metabolism regulation signal transduction histidine kinase